MKKILPKVLVISCWLLGISVIVPFLFSSSVFAQQFGGGTTSGQWVFDPVVTEVGKSSERARQLLYWVFSHPSIDTAAILAKMWSLSRNIVYVFFVLVLVFIGLGLILSKRKGPIGPIYSGMGPVLYGATLPSLLIKIAFLLLYVTFSYIIILGLIQFGDILMRFFIEKVGGCNLFNINFTGAGSSCELDPSVIREMEKNYIEFKGFRLDEPLNLEMINTSIFIIRLTTLTYNLMAALLILRKVILWFLLIVSPFLALLMPFIFIRNTGWVWIGVFFQWLFYGPLMALFIAGIANIWQAGIPFPFDFGRINCPNASCPGLEGQVYPTSINILYGGPAQTLTPTNSANYVDTYAEYIISLIMLWGAMFLPWLLLRIFRDYCCEIMEASRATLVSILDRLRSWGAPTKPPSPLPPETRIAEAIKLPFRKLIEKEEKITLEKITDISRVETHQLAQALNLSVSSLQDVAQFEMSKERQKTVETSLNKISRPETVETPVERKQFASIRNELFARAAAGDPIARRVITASQRRKEELLRVKPEAVSLVRRTTSEIAQKTGLSQEKVQEIISTIPTISVLETEKPRVISQRTGIPEGQVKEVLKVIPTISTHHVNLVAQKAQASQDEVKKIIAMLPIAGSGPAQKTIIAEKTKISVNKVQAVLTALEKPVKAVVPPPKPPTISVEDYEEVKRMWVNHYKEAEVPISDKIKTRTDWITEDVKKITNALNLLTSMEEKLKEKGAEQVAGILPFLLLGGFSDLETITYLKAKLEAAKQVQEILSAEEKVKKEEEELVEIPVKKKEEKLKEMELEAKRKREKPEEEVIKEEEKEKVLKEKEGEETTMVETSEEDERPRPKTDAEETPDEVELVEVPSKKKEEGREEKSLEEKKKKTILEE